MSKLKLDVMQLLIIFFVPVQIRSSCLTNINKCIFCFIYKIILMTSSCAAILVKSLYSFFLECSGLPERQKFICIIRHIEVLLRIIRCNSLLSSGFAISISSIQITSQYNSVRYTSTKT